jgi:hypothetical protein
MREVLDSITTYPMASILLAIVIHSTVSEVCKLFKRK